MSATFSLLSRNMRVVSTVCRSKSHIRSFHSPFAALGNSPLMSPPLSASYEKQTDQSSEPLKDARTYVVSEPDASSKFYSVPSGAYPTSSPYVNFPTTEAPNTNGTQVSSTSSTPLAHEQTIRTVPTHPGGVGASASMAHPADLMDKEGTISPQVTLTKSNPPPDGPMAKTFSKMGNDDAWKERK